jgi:hypothetical protein
MGGENFLVTISTGGARTSKKKFEHLVILTGLIAIVIVLALWNLTLNLELFWRTVVSSAWCWLTQAIRHNPYGLPCKPAIVWHKSCAVFLRRHPNKLAL